MPRIAIVAQEPFEIRLLHQHLIVNGNGAVGWLQQSLELWRAEKDFGGTVSIVVHQFKARHEAARCELVCQCLRTDQIAPDFRAQVGRVNSAENAMPISVISLASQNAVP